MVLSFFYSYKSRQPQDRTLEEIVEMIRSDRNIASLTDAYRRTHDKTVKQHFRQPSEGEKGEFMPVATALQIVSGGISQKLSAVKMGRAFKELGFCFKKTGSVRGYIVVRYTAEEMQHRRELAARL